MTKSRLGRSAAPVVTAHTLDGACPEARESDINSALVNTPEPDGVGRCQDAVVEIVQLRERLGASLVGAATPLAAADRLCEACVDLLNVDGASISMIKDGESRGTFGSSGQLSRTLDELQFTYGQGPCLDAVKLNRPVSAEDLDGAGEDRWPALAEAVLSHGIRAIYALPVKVASTPIGALDLYRHRRGPLDGSDLTGGLWAAGLASLPLLDLMTADVDWQSAADGDDGFEQLASLERVEVYQATGMIIAALNVTAADAVALLRAHAVAHDLTASDAAYRILDGRIVLSDGALRSADGGRDQ